MSNLDFTGQGDSEPSKQQEDSKTKAKKAKQLDFT